MASDQCFGKHPGDQMPYVMVEIKNMNQWKNPGSSLIEYMYV